MSLNTVILSSEIQLEGITLSFKVANPVIDGMLELKYSIPVNKSKQLKKPSKKDNMSDFIEFEWVSGF